jgi:hypothetical protein
MLAMPLPFMRMMGLAGFLIPCVSILAAVTRQPALLSLYGRRGTARKRILPSKPCDSEQGAWGRLARSTTARAWAFLAGGMALLVAAVVPAFHLKLAPGSTYGIPRTPQAIRGFDYEQLILAGKHDYGFPQEQSFLKRLPSTLIPPSTSPHLATKGRVPSSQSFSEGPTVGTTR